MDPNRKAFVLNVIHCFNDLCNLTATREYHLDSTFVPDIKSTVTSMNLLIIATGNATVQAVPYCGPFIEKMNTTCEFIYLTDVIL